MKQSELDEITEAVRIAASEAAVLTIEKELGQYKVPKEQHYQDHLWVNKMIKMQETMQNSILRGFIGIVIAGLAGLMIYGVIFWGKQNI